jgi:23S rRNA pseudouridine2605 synthase
MDSQERLQKIIAASGLASRRKAELLIQQGRVTVNGQVITKLGVKADPSRDYIKVDGKLIHGSSQRIYILLNKPREVISSIADPHGRVKVTDLVGVKAKIYPVGRLDYNTEGLILLTNDGDFSKIVTCAGKHMQKVYYVKVRSKPDEIELDRMRNGMRLRPGTQLAPCKIVPIRESTNSWYEITLIQGKNRQIREMFESIGHPVSKLRRVRIGFLTDRGLRVGQFRHLTLSEVQRVLHLGEKLKKKVGKSPESAD